MDAREGAIDEMEHQLFKAARSGSMSAIIYWLDHQGRDRGWGDQEAQKESAEDVNIVFGEISEKDLEEGKRMIAEAQKKETPTLAAELAALEVPKPATSHELAAAEDFVRSLNQESSKKNTEIQPQNVSEPPYAQTSTSDQRYDFLETAFAEGADSPFGAFD